MNTIIQPTDNINNPCVRAISYIESMILKSEMDSLDSVELSQERLFPKYSKQFNKLSKENKAILLTVHAISVDYESVVSKRPAIILAQSLLFNSLLNNPKMFNDISKDNILDKNNTTTANDFLNNNISENDIKAYQQEFSSKLSTIEHCDFCQFNPNSVTGISFLENKQTNKTLLAYEGKNSETRNVYKVFDNKKEAVSFVKYKLANVLKEHSANTEKNKEKEVAVEYNL